MGTSLARLGSAPADFDLIGIEPAAVQSWAGSVVESHTDSAIWGLMYMGRRQ
ncbi:MULTISPECIES: hypothetical protein [unclassified Streptomyces]|uniref:hypothetical protein n=1 Tax=unclassified Streptomyces TaxID=2593676 RepID=UPI002DDB99E8|nr:hypothetical protein [Streptomyces sp. NBC_00243]WRZ18573.1 hypothetical protein OHT59_08745 [Streptomyces sp. NBC_00243]